MPKHTYTERRPLEYPYSAAYDLGYSIDRVHGRSGITPGVMLSVTERIEILSRGFDFQEAVRVYYQGITDAFRDHMANDGIFGDITNG